MYAGLQFSYFLTLFYPRNSVGLILYFCSCLLNSINCRKISLTTVAQLCPGQRRAMFNRTHRGIDIVGRDELKKRKTNNEINVIINLEMNFFFISKTNAEQNGSTVKVVRGDGEGGGEGS